MLIDWFTVVAQTANFLILVWLLKRFLYQPILNAIAAREQRIAAKLADADALKVEAHAERDAYQRKNAEFDQQRTELFNRVTAEAASERQRLLDAAQQDADSLRARQQTSLRDEYKNLNAEIARRTQAEVLAIARKTLQDLAGESLEARMLETLLLRLQALGGDEKKRLAALFQLSHIPVLVRSAFDLQPAQREQILQAVQAIFAAEIQLQFEIVPDLVCGIELTLPGQKIAWSVGDYLAALDRSINELLKSQRQARAIPGAHEQSR